jgi:hypothetical protein
MEAGGAAFASVERRFPQSYRGFSGNDRFRPFEEFRGRLLLQRATGSIGSI